jgi:hypothetical protein
MDENCDDAHSADPRGLESGWSRPCDGNHNDDSKTGEDAHGSGTWTGKSRV